MFDLAGPLSFVVAAYLLITFEARSYAAWKQSQNKSEEEDAVEDLPEPLTKPKSSWRIFIGSVDLLWPGSPLCCLNCTEEHRRAMNTDAWELASLSMFYCGSLELFLLHPYWSTLSSWRYGNDTKAHRTKQPLYPPPQPSVLGYGFGLILAVGSSMASMGQFFWMIYVNAALVALVVASTLYRTLV